MIISDHGRVYDSEEMQMIASKAKEERDSYERDIHNEFVRLVYLRYVNIRSIISNNMCRKMQPQQVLEELDAEKIKQYYNWTTEEVVFYVKFAKKYISITG